MIRAGNETTSMTNFEDSTDIGDTHPLITIYREVFRSIVSWLELN